MAYDHKLGYDPDFDYSRAIMNASSDEERERLRQERQRKVDGKYGGNDPYKGTTDIMGTGSGTPLGNGTPPGGTTPSGGGWTPSASYTENIAADAGLTDAQLAQIQQYREQAKAGVISWKQANQMANAIRMEAGGYTVDNTGKATYTQQTGKDPYGSFRDYLADMGYSDYADQTRAAIQAAVEAAISNYNQQIAQTEQESGELARQAYVTKMMGQKNLDQQMAAEGYAGGMADSQRIQTELGYQSQLSEIEKQRMLTVQELQNAITQAKLSGDLQTAQELASYLQQIQGQWASYVAQRQQQENTNYWNQQSADEQSKANAYERAMNLLSAGITPDAATLAAAGISAQEAAQILRYYGGGVSSGGGASGGGTAYTGGTSGGTSSGGGNTTYRGSSGYDNGALSERQVQELQQALGVTADGKWGAKSSAAAGGLDANAAWAKYREGGYVGEIRYASQLSQRARDELTYAQRQKSINGGVTAGVRDRLVSLTEQGKLTDAELAFMMNALGIG